MQDKISSPKPLRLGFVPLTDCAPLVVAQEFGLFRKCGIRVTLYRELGWASVRDKVIHRELDAAHALASMPVAATFGLGSVRCECLTGLVLNLHGNAITLSNALRKEGVVNGPSLREAMLRLRQEKTFTFGVVAPYSSHNFLLRKWMSSAGIHPDRDVRIVVMPPPQMVANLAAGHLDGFCAGEPWNSVAAQSRVGWCAAASAELAPGHPEKVLMVRRDFAEKRAEEHVALIAALLEACILCDQSEHQGEIVELLARSEYVDVSASALRQGMRGEFDCGNGNTRTIRDFAVFNRNDANEPSADKAAWVLQQMRELVTTVESAVFTPTFTRGIFRADIFEEANRLRGSQRNSTSNERVVLTHQKPS